MRMKLVSRLRVLLRDHLRRLMTNKSSLCHSLVFFFFRISDATTDLDIAVAEVLTLSSAMRVFTSQGTWLCAFAYMTTFGFELAVDANLAAVLYASHSSAAFGQETAGYCKQTEFDVVHNHRVTIDV